MYDKKELDNFKKKKEEWEKECYLRHVKKHSERKKNFTNLSSINLDNVFTPDDVSHLDFDKSIGLPGIYPFLRGIHPTMYRGRLWTMRQFSGFGSAEETNKRYKYLLEHGETGLSVAFDYPTLYGYDTDQPLSRGEFGKCGVAISSLKDMEILFDGIPIDEVTTSMTINGPAPIILAMFLNAAIDQKVEIIPVWANKGYTPINFLLMDFLQMSKECFAHFFERRGGAAVWG